MENIETNKPDQDMGVKGPGMLPQPVLAPVTNVRVVDSAKLPPAEQSISANVKDLNLEESGRAKPEPDKPKTSNKSDGHKNKEERKNDKPSNGRQTKDDDVELSSTVMRIKVGNNSISGEGLAPAGKDVDVTGMTSNALTYFAQRLYSNNSNVLDVRDGIVITNMITVNDSVRPVRASQQEDNWDFWCQSGTHMYQQHWTPSTGIRQYEYAWGAGFLGEGHNFSARTVSTTLCGTVGIPYPATTQMGGFMAEIMFEASTVSFYAKGWCLMAYLKIVEQYNNVEYRYLPTPAQEGNFAMHSFTEQDAVIHFHHDLLNQRFIILGQFVSTVHMCVLRALSKEGPFGRDDGAIVPVLSRVNWCAIPTSIWFLSEPPALPVEGPLTSSAVHSTMKMIANLRNEHDMMLEGYYKAIPVICQKQVSTRQLGRLVGQDDPFDLYGPSPDEDDEDDELNEFTQIPQPAKTGTGAQTTNTPVNATNLTNALDKIADDEQSDVPASDTTIPILNQPVAWVKPIDKFAMQFGLKDKQSLTDGEIQLVLNAVINEFENAELLAIGGDINEFGRVSKMITADFAVVFRHIELQLVKIHEFVVNEMNSQIIAAATDDNNVANQEQQERANKEAEQSSTLAQLIMEREKELNLDPENPLRLTGGGGETANKEKVTKKGPFSKLDTSNKTNITPIKNTRTAELRRQSTEQKQKQQSSGRGIGFDLLTTKSRPATHPIQDRTTKRSISNNTTKAKGVDKENITVNKKAVGKVDVVTVLMSLEKSLKEIDDRTAYLMEMRNNNSQSNSRRNSVTDRPSGSRPKPPSTVKNNKQSDHEYQFWFNCLVEPTYVFRWPRPNFGNPIWYWLNCIPARSTAAINDEIRIMSNSNVHDLLTCMNLIGATLNVGMGLAFHNMNIDGYFLNDAASGENQEAYLAVSAMFQQVISATMTQRTPLLICIATSQIAAVTGIAIPSAAYQQPAWCHNWDRMNNINDQNWWAGAFQFRTPYLFEPLALTFIYQLWPNYWGYFRNNVTVDLRNDFVVMGTNAGWYSSRGDERYSSAVRHESNTWTYINYGICVLNALQQHYRMAEPVHFMFQRWPNSPSHTLMEPALTFPDPLDENDYVTDLGVYRPGVLRTYDWRHGELISVVVLRYAINIHWNALCSTSYTNWDGVGLFIETLRSMVGGNAGQYDLLGGFNLIAKAVQAGKEEKKTDDKKEN